MSDLDRGALLATFGDQRWRLDNLYWIIDKQGRRIKFKMNWAQRELFDQIHCNNLILKVRQLGLSTLVNLLQLDTALFVPNTACGVIAHNDDSAKELFARNVKFPYENLPAALRRAVPAVTDSIHRYRFANGSSIRVATSLRSGTIHFLHISEFGKICAQFPPRAKEVVTGSLETVAPGNLVVIESTAEGNEGYFYDYTQRAKALAEAKKTPGVADYRFFFFPWWKEPTYSLADPQPINDALRRYFAQLEAEIGRPLGEPQRNWYAAKREKLQEDCFREYPSTPDEAFKVATEGAYYSAQLAQARKDGRICAVPPDPRAPLNTFWDIGIDDFTAIWVHQQVGTAHHFIGYHEGSGEPLQHYWNLLKERHLKPGFAFGTHYLPHDAAKRDPKDGKTYADEAEKLGMRPIRVVPATDLLKGIQATRDGIAISRFDEVACAEGIKRLSKYRRAWNERLGCFQSQPLHDDNSHGADAFRQWAQGFARPDERREARDSADMPAAAGWT